MLITYSDTRSFNLRAIPMLAGILGLFGYGLIISALMHNGSLSLPFAPKHKGLAVIAPAPTAPSCNFSTKAWTCDFSKFPSGSISRKDWNTEIGSKAATYNDELQTYTPRTANLRIDNKALVIEAKPENFNGKKYTSARIDTKGKFAFTYGTLQIEAMIPKGDGSWPAAWLLPSGDKYKPSNYGIKKDDPLQWALNGEIDFMESYGDIPGETFPTIHYYNAEVQKKTIPPSLILGNITSPFDEYHRYGIIKTPDKITFLIDGFPYGTQEKDSKDPLDWPYDQPYYLILNLAIREGWVSKTIDDSQAPWQMKIRSISYQPL